MSLHICYDTTAMEKVLKVLKLIQNLTVIMFAEEFRYFQKYIKTDYVLYSSIFLYKFSRRKRIGDLNRFCEVLMAIRTKKSGDLQKLC